MTTSKKSADIEHLKKERKWAELYTLYSELSHQESNLEQRLFFDWERATLLATELRDPAGAIDVLKEATLSGGPIELIVPQIEAIRQAAANHIEAQFKAIEAYKVLLKQNSLSRMTVEIQKWLRETEKVITRLTPQVDSLFQGHVDADEDEDDFDESLLDEVDIIDETFVRSPKLEAQSTSVLLKDDEQKLKTQLTHEASLQEPIRWMNNIRSLAEIRALSSEDRKRYEPLLWQAASQGSQWRLWVHIFEAHFLTEPLDGLIDIDRAFKLASILELKLDDYDRSIELYSLILDHEQTHDEAFDRLRVLLKTQEKWDHLGKLLLNFSSQTEHSTKAHWDKNARFEICLEAGDCYAQHLENYAKAITAWFQALEVNPESKQIFVRLVEVYQKSQKWSACIKVLRKLSTLEEDSTKAAFHLYSIGQIQRDQLRDQYLAVRSFDEALDLDPYFVKAFQAIDDTLEKAEIDQSLIERRDRYYRKMLIRAVEHDFEPSMIAELALQVGSINGDMLGRWSEAKRAFELVLEYEPMRDEAHLGLVESTAQTEGATAAISLAFAWVRRSPQQPLAYLSLFERSMQARKWDDAWCAAMTLDAIGHSAPDVSRHLEAGRELLGSQLQRSISAESWKLLEWSSYEWGGDGDELGTAISILGGSILNLYGATTRSLGLHTKHDLINDRDSSIIYRVAHYICQSLNLVMPQLWLSSALSERLMSPVYSQSHLGLVLNREIFSRLSVEELACTLTVGLVCIQPNTALTLLPEREQALTDLEAAFSSLGGYVQGQAMSKRGQELEGMMKTLSPKTLNDLQTLISHLPNDHSSWLVATEQTAYRASLLICGDPRLVDMLMRRFPRLSKDSEQERRFKLMLFSVSPPYLKLRELLGLSWKD